MKTLQDVIRFSADFPRLRVAVAVAEDEEVLHAVEAAEKQELAQFLLFGHKERVQEILHLRQIKLQYSEIINVRDPLRACREAVFAVNKGDADIVMKGMVATSEILRAVLDREHGLRTNRILSHIAVFEVPKYDRLFFVTDAAMNIAPNLEQKEQIIQNCITLCHALGIERPKVASLAAIETVNPLMQATVDAAILSKMAQRGQIKQCEIEGPFALDNAISQEAARHKGITNEVAGKADVLLVPDIEAGNLLYKSLVYFAGARVGGMVAGGKAPVILTSRADTRESKLYSIALAAVSAHQIYNQGVIQRLLQK
jgi:phosphate butyryltransferase